MIGYEPEQVKALSSTNGMAVINEFTTEVGVILRTRKVRLPVVMAIMKNIAVPKPPRVYIPELERDEENPNDPAYKDAISMYQANRAMAMTRAYLMFGSDIKYAPDDFLLPNDDWDKEFTDVGIAIPSKEQTKLRYVAWLEYTVISDNIELAELQKSIMRLSGVTFEEDVKEAEDSFPDNEGRNTD